MSEPAGINFEGIANYDKYIILHNKKDALDPTQTKEFEYAMLEKMANEVLSKNILNSTTFEKRIKEIEKNNGNKLLRLLTDIANESYKKEKLFYDKLQQNVKTSKIVKSPIAYVGKSNNKVYNVHRYHQPCNQKALYIANFLDQNNDLYIKILQDISSSSYIERFIKSDPKITSEYQVYVKDVKNKGRERYITGLSKGEREISTTAFTSMSRSAKGRNFTEKGYNFAEDFALSAIDIIKQRYPTEKYTIENDWEDKIIKFMIHEVVLYAHKPVLPKSGTADINRTRRASYGLNNYDDKKLKLLMENFLQSILEDIGKKNNVSSIIDVNTTTNTETYDTFFEVNFRNSILILSGTEKATNDIIDIQIELTDGSKIIISETKVSSGNKSSSIYRYSNENKDFSINELNNLATHISNTIQENLSSELNINNQLLISNIEQQIKSLYYQYQNSNKTSSFFAYLFGTAGTANVQAKVQGTLGEVINAAILQTLFPNDKVSILGQTSNDLSQQAHIDIQIEINGNGIGIQSKQYNASEITDIKKFYADDYNLFSDTIERYFTRGDGSIDKELIKILKWYSYRLITSKKEYGELPENIETEIALYFEQFARIADYTNLDLKNIKTNFFAYNFTLIPMSYIIHLIINSIYNKGTVNSQSLFKIQAPKFNLKASKSNSAGTGTEGIVTVNLQSIQYNESTYGYTYQLMNTSGGTRNLVANVHFNGITVSVANLL